jgi:hypothetical protein
MYGGGEGGREGERERERRREGDRGWGVDRVATLCRYRMCPLECSLENMFYICIASSTWASICICVCVRCVSVWAYGLSYALSVV